MTELKRTLVEDVFFPPHEPRKASAVYRKTHHKLVVEMDEPCWICGIRHSDVVRLTDTRTGLTDIREQRRRQLETHHDELEWAAANGTDLEAITRDFPVIMQDPKRLRDWLDSEGNMLVLCALHHRGPRTGIHSITYPAWKLQRWQTSWTFIPQT
ncbi:MAG: hypothetical protein ACYC9L_05605 [Sulfuricaulis sp.]